MSVEQRTVLVADDDAAIRHLVRLLLTKDGFAVEEAVNGRDALDRLRRKRYDCMILDLMMGPGSGFDVLDTMKRERPGRRFVVVASATAARTIDQLDSDNIVAKIRKPFDIEELLRVVRKCCEDHSSGVRSPEAWG